MELFVFLQMGGASERLRVMALNGAAPAETLARFNAAKAQCYWDKDRQKLLGVIETGFGDLKPFNKLVHDILRMGESQSSRGSLSA